jgi:hypothetical protein
MQQRDPASSRLSLSLSLFSRAHARAYSLNYDNNERQISENNRPVKDARTTLYYCREAEESAVPSAYIFFNAAVAHLKYHPSLSSLIKAL